jgi:hypothetical protein
MQTPLAKWNVTLDVPGHTTQNTNGSTITNLAGYTIVYGTNK